MSKIALFICGILLVALGCRPEATQTIPAQPVQKSVAAQSAGMAREAWEEEWDRVKAEARKEGKVVITGNVGPAADVLRKVLNEKFGINPEFMVGRGAEVAQKIKSEQIAGLYTYDVILSTTMNIILYLKPEGRVDRIDTGLILPEVKDPKLWYQGQIPWVDVEKRYHLAFFAVPKSGVVINGQMVTQKDINSYYDLLDPRWKGKILINDPTVSGAGNAWFTPLAEEIGLEYFSKLLRQEPLVLRDQRLMTEWVARGKYPILLGSDENTAAEFIKAGAPITGIQMKEGAYTTQSNGAVSIPVKAPHPNAAKVVLNWVLSKEGGTVLSEAMLTQSSRVDVPTDFLPVYDVRQPGMKYVDSSPEAYQIKKGEYIKVAKDIFGPVLK